MSDVGFETVGVELRKNAVYAASCVDLDITFDENLAQRVVTTSVEKLLRPPAEEGELREATAHSESCVSAAKELMRPVVDQLFSGPSYHQARNEWKLFNINYYETGDRNPRHTDFKVTNPGMVVVILSLCGVRRLEVHHNPHIELTHGMLAFLSGRENPLHAAECTSGPSVSVVVDVPGVTY